MDDRIVSANTLHRFVPAERTGVLASAQEDTNDGLVLVERYAYPERIPERTSPPVGSHSLTIMLMGRATVEHRFGDEPWTEIDVSPGVMSLRPAERALTLRGSGQGLDTLSVRFPPSLLRRIAAENQTDPTTLRLRGKPALQDPVLARLGQAIRQQMESEGEISTVVLTSIVESIVTRLFVEHCAGAHEVRARGPLSADTVDRIRAYVRAHLADDIKVADLASCVNMGVSHFTRLFKQTVGTSPYQYVLRQRVEAARQQLRDTDEPIARIALNVGFSSQSHLTRRFKKIVGTTPGRYRDSLQ